MVDVSRRTAIRAALLAVPTLATEGCGARTSPLGQASTTEGAVTTSTGGGGSTAFSPTAPAPTSGAATTATGPSQTGPSQTGTPAGTPASTTVTPPGTTPVTAPPQPTPGSTTTGRVRAVPRPPHTYTRRAWAGSLPVRGTLGVEKKSDVKFILIHHSESPNTVTRTGVGATLRGFYRHHTTTKGWPDVAYNFFVDPYGRIFEGRAGSLTRPVMGSATGGSQGHAILCCFVGSFTSRLPTPAAMEAMAALVAWQADVYDINLYAGRTISFVSRGSNRWPRGKVVKTLPVAGHRTMSQTDCPGDALYRVLQTRLVRRARVISTRAKRA